MRKHFLAAVCLVMIMSTLSILHADLDIFDVCTAVGDQSEPDIDGNWIVWQDERNGSQNRDIYAYTLAEPNEIEVCTVTGSDQEYPSVSGNIVVWQDKRNNQRDIYAFDLSSQTSLTLAGMPYNDGVYQMYPEISGNTFIFRNRPDGVYNLFAYDIDSQTPTQVSDAASTPINHAFDGTVAVWMESTASGYQVFYRDIRSVGALGSVTEDTYGQWYPAVSGSLIVWAEDRGTGTGLDLYGFDMNHPEDGDFPVCVAPGIQTRPAIDGTVVVWQDRPDGQADYDIRGLDMSGGNSFPITTDTKNDQMPAISGRIVVWQRNNTDWDIVGAEIPSTTELQVLEPAGDEQVLAGSSMMIDWELVDGEAPALVNLEFSSVDGAGWELIDSEVPFGTVYLWQPVADVDSSSCRIRVSATDDPSVSNVSEAFTIFQCSAALTADVTGDCFVGIEDFAELCAQWLRCGHPTDESWCFN